VSGPISLVQVPSAESNDLDARLAPYLTLSAGDGRYLALSTGTAISAELTAHEGRTDNPHAVTAAQVGAMTQAAADGRYLQLSTGGTVTAEVKIGKGTTSLSGAQRPYLWVELGTADTNREPLFRIFNQNIASGNFVFGGLELGIGTGTIISTGFGYLRGLAPDGTSVPLLEFQRTGTSGSIRFRQPPFVSNAVDVQSSSTDVGAQVALLRYGSDNNLWVGPRFSLGALKAYGVRFFLDSTAARFTWEINGQSGSPLMILDSGGDLTLGLAGKGVVLKTPDGTHTYRLGISNAGALTITQVT
jgi:hypothetical protein